MRNVSRFGDWPSHVVLGLLLLGTAWIRGSRKWSRIFLAMLIAMSLAGVAANVIKRNYSASATVSAHRRFAGADRTSAPSITRFRPGMLALRPRSLASYCSRGERIGIVCFADPDSDRVLADVHWRPLSVRCGLRRSPGNSLCANCRRPDVVAPATRRTPLANLCLAESGCALTLVRWNAKDSSLIKIAALCSYAIEDSVQENHIVDRLHTVMFLSAEIVESRVAAPISIRNISANRKPPDVAQDASPTRWTHVGMCPIWAMCSGAFVEMLTADLPAEARWIYRVACFATHQCRKIRLACRH